MKKLAAILLTLALLIPCAAALAEESPLHLGYIAPADAEDGRYSLCADAFAYAAEQQGAKLTILRFDPSDGEVPEGADSEDRMDPAIAALMTLIEDGVDGAAIAAASVEQARQLIDLAQEAGMPVVIEGQDVSAFYPQQTGAAASPEETPDPASPRPYVAAVGYGDAAAYAASMWLEDAAYNPLLFHCALPASDPAIESGIRRAVKSGRYLELAGAAVNASANTAAAGSYAVDLFTASGAIYGCVLADSEYLAEGCARRIRELGDSMPITAIASSAHALELLQSGTIDMLAATPASVEGVQTFKLLHDFVTQGILPETATGYVQLEIITATSKDASAWISDDDYETAYALAYPEAE